MRGNVLGFDMGTGQGTVSDASGNRHNFSAGDWKSAGQPSAGAVVDYTISGDRAVDLYLVPGATGMPGGVVDPLHKQAQTWGIIALVSGILAFPFFFIAFILDAVAIYFGIKAKNAGGGLPTKGPYYMGIAGIVLGAINILLWLLTLALCGVGGILGAMSDAPH